MSWGYYEYVPVAQKREKAARALAKYKKKNADISPIIVEGNKIAKTWWGMSWNKNLESYADYSNRIGRGRSYVRNGMVLDLQIDVGKVFALVMGSGATPYQVTIQIDCLPSPKWNNIVKKCSHSIGTIEELIAGKFPQELADFFLQQGEGLFPTPKEIHLDCSCPDWATMCKHVAAALYGIGTRLDQQPLLFFKLRDVSVEELIKKSVTKKMESLLKNAEKKSERVLEGVDLEELFGL
jgi:uncharacterized Zn finger protein